MKSASVGAALGDEVPVNKWQHEEPGKVCCIICCSKCHKTPYLKEKKDEPGRYIPTSQWGSCAMLRWECSGIAA